MSSPTVKVNEWGWVWRGSAVDLNDKSVGEGCGAEGGCNYVSEAGDVGKPVHGCREVGDVCKRWSAVELFATKLWVANLDAVKNLSSSVPAVSHADCMLAPVDHHRRSRCADAMPRDEMEDEGGSNSYSCRTDAAAPGV